MRTFPGIRGSAVYPFCYESKSTIILSAIFSLFRFGDQVLFSLLGIGGRKKQRGARERHAYLLARTFFIAPYFDVDILNSASRILQG